MDILIPLHGGIVEAQMLTDVLTERFALCASADSGPESVLSPHVINSLPLEL